MKPYLVTIGHRDSPRLSFAAMAPDSCTAVMQHIDLCEVGERCEAIAPGHAQRVKDLEQSIARSLAERDRMQEERRAAGERGAAAFREWEASRTKARPAGTYGRLTCSLCGDEASSQVCSHCSKGLAARGGTL